MNVVPPSIAAVTDLGEPGAGRATSNQPMNRVTGGMRETN